MKRPLLLSLATIALLSSNLNAATMYDKFQTMELEMKKMKQELKTLKEEQAAVAKAVEAAKEEAQNASEDEDEEESVTEQLEELQESVSDLNRATNGNHVKFGVDYRYTVENLQYKMADGSEQNNDAFMTNRFWLNMNWATTKHISFSGQLAYNKAFGARSGAQTGPYETFDWIANENAYNDTLRIRSAYFYYKNDTFLGTDIPWTFSIGRRPSTNGHLVNLRDDDHAASPMGHNINVEFDGLSSKFALEELTGVDGMYIKVCAGRGLSNAKPRLSTAPYTTEDTTTPDIDLAGLIFTPYSDGQYSFNTQYYYANNLIDAIDPTNPSLGFKAVGGLHAFTANIIANGIGDGISDFLDDTTLFVSGAVSITDPSKNGGGMLGRLDPKTGYSAWAGLQIPSLISEEGRWGIEYNWGSKFWRSMTYGEDTNIGSKLAVRGDAYEAYFTEPLLDDVLSMQIRYTYIDYKFSGSNGFFGNATGEPLSMDQAVASGLGSFVVDTAQDIRFYIRYRY
ncbi:DUF3373 family protein [Sulfurimonas sp.]|uniref:DUF3373 family protein n=1 Tax=Sulfurimonas sp. TaxID=2022749 RepID=UPI00262B347C|nr:DUF3373 family protein [Sulfurimonas sp.]